MQQIEDALRTYTDQWPNYLVYQAAKYSLLSEGKRIRPILTVAAYGAVGRDGDGVLIYACALEMIHASSLILDDLMDHDDYRRGQLACHKKYGINIALMASQLLCAEAYLLMKNPICLQEILLATRQMCIGQAAEIDEYKTGSLIRASVRIGAIVGGATEEQLESLTKYGEQIGLLFQVTDDIIDNERPKEELSLDLSCLEIFGEKANSLREIARFIVERIN